MTQIIFPENFLMTVITASKVVHVMNLLFKGTIYHIQAVFLNVLYSACLWEPSFLWLHYVKYFFKKETSLDCIQSSATNWIWCIYQRKRFSSFLFLLLFIHLWIIFWKAEHRKKEAWRSSNFWFTPQRRTKVKTQSKSFCEWPGSKSLGHHCCFQDLHFQEAGIRRGTAAHT